MSFLSNTYYANLGALGYNCNIPIIKGQTKQVRLHFNNTGSTDVKIKYSVIYYGEDDGAVELTVKAGESKSVIMDLTHYQQNSTTQDAVVGANHQIVFPDGAEAGATFTVWGEFITDELSSISISHNANKLTFAPGDIFTSEGLILKAISTVTAGDGNNLYHRVYVSSNYVTDFDGHVFTEEELGTTQTVTVTFGGVTTTYNITVHAHSMEYVEEVSAVVCSTDGVAAHYKCSDPNCNAYFEDAAGKIRIAAPKKISCHTAPEGAILPGVEVTCTACGSQFIAEASENWVFLNITTDTTSIGSNIKNGQIQQALVNGMPGTKIYIGAGTTGATNSSAFYLNMKVNEPARQTVIPNLGNYAVDGQKRTVVLYYENYSDVDLVMNLQNERGGTLYGYTGSVTIPANGTLVVSFSMSNTGGGADDYRYYVDCSPTQDVSFGVYGYIYINNGETDAIAINSPALKTTYKVGEEFSSDGLILNATIPSSNSHTLYVQTGYATDFDGKVFTESDIGKHMVTVFFAGKITIYEINVTE